MVNNKENGFTFLEMILVLSIVSLVTFTVIPIGEKWIRTTSEESELQALMAAIHNMQAYSMANHVLTKVEFKNSGTMYVTSAPGRVEFARTTFLSGMERLKSSSLKAVEFNANGDMISTGTLAFKTSSGVTQIRFQFQRGRMIIYEIE